MSLITWQTTSTSPGVNFMTTTLAALASSTLSVVSSVTQVNSSQLRIYCDAELLVGTTAGAFGVGGYMALYTVPSMAGTAAELDTAELQPWTVFPMTTSTANAQHRIYRANLVTPVSDFAVAVFNGTTQALSTGSGGNTLTLAFYDVQTTGAI